MNIAMVSEHANPLASVGSVDAGGQNVHVAELARALAARGHRIRVYSRRDSLDVPERVALCEGVEVVHVPAGPPTDVPKDELLPHIPAFTRALAAYWRADPPDVVHAHFWMSGLAALAAARPLGVPVVQTFHALGVVKRRWQQAADTSPPERVRLEAALARSVPVVATSEDEVEELVLQGMRRRNARVVPCGVDTQQFRPATGPPVRRFPRRLMSVGRLVPRKGYETAIRALPYVPDAELFIVGGPGAELVATDPEAARLRAVAGECGVAHRVRFTGQVRRDALPRLLQTADAMLCTPWYEPFGMVALEAMACGVPVVASAIGGLRDTVLPGTTGELVRPRDPRTLGVVVRRLLADSTRHAGYRVASVDRVRSRYRWDRVAAETEAVYAGLLDRADLEVAG
jgi:glycosyltransferase involved in cell wall biosynthesis